PAPLWPTRPTRSPSFSDMVMSRSASMTTTFDALRPIAPPALPRNAFFSDRDLASKIGNSTHALRVSMLGCDTVSLQVLTGPVAVLTGLALLTGHDHPGRQRTLAHLLELGTGRHLLGEQRGLD